MRLLGEAFYLADNKIHDSWQPIISTVAGWISSVDPGSLVIGEHIAFWLSTGAVVAFLPYFPYSKHIHLIIAPFNFGLKPERKSIGELGYIDLDDQSIEQFGAATMKDLGWEQIMDSYACIMCMRCQEVCPAYNTGKLLSPAALEINKRYHLNHGGATDVPMLDMISEEAVWACTSCGACVDICPVGNEPMRDILDIRRNLTLMESNFPKAIGNCVQRHGTQHESLERIPSRPHEMGGWHGTCRPLSKIANPKSYGGSVVHQQLIHAHKRPRKPLQKF